jgi:hypothetical protein
MDLFNSDPAAQARSRAGEENMQKYNAKVAARGGNNGSEGSPGMLGPDYSFADELPAPAEIGVRQGGDPGAIIDAVAGVNYYVDAIGFGQKTMFNSRDMNPLGLRYFMSTGSTCSNGALMWEYLDTTPKGDLLGKRIDKALADTGLPRMRGLAPGILEDARDALNPFPIFRAAMGSGYPQCQQVTMPVGDLNGQTRSPHDPNVVWIHGHIDYHTGKPTQTKWVHAKDAQGYPLYMSQVDFENAPKTFYPDGSPMEGFANQCFWEAYIDKKVVAGLMFAGLVGAMVTFAVHKK